MASHHHPGTVIPLHRGAQPLDYPARPVDLIDQLREHGIFDERTRLERVADFFSSDRGATYCLGFYSGCMATVAAALVFGFAR